MRLGSFFKFYLITSGLLFLIFSILDLSIAKMLLLFFAYSFISPYAFKFFLEQRGVAKGDTVLVTFEKKSGFGLSIEKLPGKAITSGKIGDVIEVEFMGRRASAEVVSGGGFIFPPEVKILFYQETPIRGV